MNGSETRPLEALERMFATFHKRLGDLTAACAVRLAGFDDDVGQIEDAYRAVRGLVEKHHLLRSCITGGNRLVPLEESGNWPKLRVERQDVEDEDEDENAWQCVLQRELRHSFREGAALAQFLLYFCVSGTTYLVITAHHALFDGRSLQILVRGFLSSMAFEKSRKMSDLPISPGASPQSTSSVSMLIGQYIPNVTPPSPTPFPPAQESFIFDNPGPLKSPSEVCYIFRKLSDERVRALMQRCKLKGLRMTSLLAAAFARGLEPCVSSRVGDTMGFQCCIDLRRYMPADASEWLGNFYCITNLGIPLAHKEVPESNLGFCSEIQRELDSNLADRRFLLTYREDPTSIAASAEHLCDKVLNEGYHGRDFYSGLSNLGVIDVNVSTDVVHATEFWFTTRLARVGTFFFLYAAYIPDHGMCLVFTYPYPVCSHDTARRTCERTLAAVESYLG